jgi:hypothetical protein
MKNNYTIPKISKASHIWFVLRYEGKLFKYKHGYKLYNRFKGATNFEELAKELILKAWNPTLPKSLTKKMI